MHTDTVNQLLQLNREFYQTFASQFSATRRRLQPGVHRIASKLPVNARILDLGCGNGELARALVELDFQGNYLGLDFSPGLLATARQGLPEQPAIAFARVDFGQPDWHQIAALTNAALFDRILAFAVLHHLPGQALQRQVLTRVGQLLAPGGQLIHSNWQFLNSARLRARILPWGQVGLADSQLEPGDYLLDWRHGGQGLRYVHHFSSQELAQLADDTGFQVVEEFLSDGEGGQLGLYQIWQMRAVSKTPG